VDTCLIDYQEDAIRQLCELAMECMDYEYPEERPSAADAISQLQTTLSTCRFDVSVEDLDTEGKAHCLCQHCSCKGPRVGASCGKHFICSMCLQSHPGVLQGLEPLPCVFQGACQNYYSGEDLKDVLPYSVFESYVERKLLNSKFYAVFARTHGNIVSQDVLGAVKAGLHSIEQMHEDHMLQMESSIGGRLEDIQGIKNHL